MTFTICAVSNKTGKIIGPGDQCETMSQALTAIDYLEEARGKLDNPEFRWGVFKLTEVDVDEARQNRLPVALYTLGDKVYIHGAIAEIGSTMISPSYIRYGVHFPNGDHVVMDQKNIEGKVDV